MPHWPCQTGSRSVCVAVIAIACKYDGLLHSLVIIIQLNKTSRDRLAQRGQRPHPAGPRSTDPGLCCIAMLGPLEFKSQPKGVCCDRPLILFCKSLSRKALSRSSCACVGFIDGFFFSVKGIFLEHSRAAVIFVRQWNQRGLPARCTSHLLPPGAQQDSTSISPVCG